MCVAGRADVKRKLRVAIAATSHPRMARSARLVYYLQAVWAYSSIG